MTLKYDYTRVLVSDFGASFRFYRDVLGLAPIFGAEDDVYAEFATGEVTLALFSQAEMSRAVGTEMLPAAAISQDRVCLIFSVADVDATCATLQQAGVPLAVPPTDRPAWNIRTAHLRDPDGNLIEINQPLRR